MERRVNEMKAAGIATEFLLYRNLGHAFALGTGTSAGGWITDAIRLWEKHSKITPITDRHSIPQGLESIPGDITKRHIGREHWLSLPTIPMNREHTIRKVSNLQNGQSYICPMGIPKKINLLVIPRFCRGYLTSTFFI
jgi:hypothetical protein